MWQEFRRWVQECIKSGLLGDSDRQYLELAIEQLENQKYLAEGHKLILDAGAFGDVQRRGQTVKKLTHEQTVEFMKLWDSVVAKKRRVLKQAPSGSGI